MTAILIILRNNEFRQRIADKYAGDLGVAEELAFIAEQFGEEVKGHPYLRSAVNSDKMNIDFEAVTPHRASKILTGTLYEILVGISNQYLDKRKKSAKEAFYYASDRMRRMALQPLDLLPPVDVTYKDYTLAMLRSEQLSNPTDPYNYYELMLDVFESRLILTPEETKELRTSKATNYLNDRFSWNVFPDIRAISRSRIEAYHFLNENREVLYIPKYQDLIISDVYESNKFGRQASRLPKQIIVEYIWKEDIELVGSEFGKIEGKIAQLLCGGTLVFDDQANLLYWSRKPGADLANETRNYRSGTKKLENWERELTEGEARKDGLLLNIVNKIEKGEIAGISDEGEMISDNDEAHIIAKWDNEKVHFNFSRNFCYLGEK